MIPIKQASSPEAYKSVWAKMSDWTDAENPTSLDIVAVAQNATKKVLPSSDNVDPNVALNAELASSSQTITHKDVALYAVGIGAGAANPTCPSQLRYTYENSSHFSMLPSMGVTFVDLMGLGSLPGLSFNPMMLLHGEHYLEVLSRPLPTEGTFTSKSKIAELWDKGKAALVVIESTTSAENGKPLFLNRTSAFIRGIGGWGGERGPKPASYAPPARAADAVVTEATSKNQALLYRLPSGDANPLHADPDMAAMGGFDKPILHGLCTFGFATRAVIQSFCNNDSNRFKAISVRFAGHVFPGESIETHMWKMSETQIVFETRVVERGTVAIANAMVELFPQNAKL
jgi:3-hydroxyacyl-CoA dehydrogenase/3a,7a,12a-trihydroxy-5b-cholest-24-enoyl-CoA hydratase